MYMYVCIREMHGGERKKMKREYIQREIFVKRKKGIIKT